MIVVHHLNHSRSQRVLWALEELQVPYEIRRYERDRETMLAPPELRTLLGTFEPAARALLRLKGCKRNADGAMEALARFADGVDPSHVPPG